MESYFLKRQKSGIGIQIENVEHWMNVPGSIIVCRRQSERIN